MVFLWSWRSPLALSAPGHQITLTSVPHVVVNIVFLAREGLLTNIATMWRLTRVFAHMIDHVLLARKRLGAVLATERRFARMRTKMIVQMLFACESLLANGAGEWFVR